MNDLEDYTFEDGVTIGNDFLKLASEIDPKVTKMADQFLSSEEIVPIYTEIIRRSPYGRTFPCVEGMLSRILCRQEFEIPLCKVWVVDEFWERQTDYALICEIPEALGFIQFGDWVGESDGDAWLIDTTRGIISAMYVGSGESDGDKIRLSCYANFSSPWQWISYLRCEAWEREWVEKPTSQ